jgi:large subunit ribosomal protein L27e
MGVIKSGKVVLVLQGRFAGRKAVVVRTYDNGSATKKFPHALVAGIDRNPRKVTKAMSKDKIAKRTKVKPFLKCVNYNHIMPTRYVVDLDLKKLLPADDSQLDDSKVEVKKAVKAVFEERYRGQKGEKSEKKAQGTQYFFKKLRF